jgi:hypothetical protein
MRLECFIRWWYSEDLDRVKKISSMQTLPDFREVRQCSGTYTWNTGGRKDVRKGWHLPKASGTKIGKWTLNYAASYCEAFGDVTPCLNQICISRPNAASIRRCAQIPSSA